MATNFLRRRTTSSSCHLLLTPACDMIYTNASCIKRRSRMAASLTAVAPRLGSGAGNQGGGHGLLGAAPRGRRQREVAAGGEEWMRRRLRKIFIGRPARVRRQGHSRLSTFVPRQTASRRMNRRRTFILAKGETQGCVPRSFSGTFLGRGLGAALRSWLSWWFGRCSLTRGRSGSGSTAMASAAHDVRLRTAIVVLDQLGYGLGLYYCWLLQYYWSNKGEKKGNGLCARNVEGKRSKVQADFRNRLTFI